MDCESAVIYLLKIWFSPEKSFFPSAFHGRRCLTTPILLIKTIKASGAKKAFLGSGVMEFPLLNYMSEREIFGEFSEIFRF